MLQLSLVIFGFLLTGVVGNWLIYRWQHRNWINQQRITRASLGLTELRQLIYDIMKLSDTRNYRARKLIRSIHTSSKKEIEGLRQEYGEAVAAWNDNWNTFCVGLTFHAGYDPYVRHLDEKIQQNFVLCGGLLHYSLRHGNHELSRTKSRVEEILNQVSGSTFNLSRDLHKLLEEKERAAFSDLPQLPTVRSVEFLSTWKLMILLFQPIRKS